MASHVERNFGQQNPVRAAGNAGMQRDPAGMAAHHLQHDDAAVGASGIAQAIDGLHIDADSGVEAERVVGFGEVVVHRFGHADRRNAVFPQFAGDAQGVLAAERDDASKPNFWMFSFTACNCAGSL